MKVTSRCPGGGGRGDRLPPPCPASPPWSRILTWWIFMVRSGYRCGQVFDLVPGRGAGQVELGGFSAAGLSCRLLLREVVGG